MLLTTRNIIPYLIDKGLLEQGEMVTIEPLSGGNINHIHKVTTPAASYVIKQALPAAKFNKSIKLSRRRVGTEFRFLEFAHQRRLGNLPEPILLDERRKALIMTAIPEDYELLTFSLIRGEVNLKIAEKLATFYATLHSETYKDKALRKAFPMSDIYEKLKLRLFYQELIDSTDDPLIKENVWEMQEKCRRNKLCLIQGDALPKNFLVKGDDMFLLDHELAIFGDPAHDLNLLISHYLVGALINYPERERYYKAITHIFRSYSEQATFKKLLPKVLRNATRHVAPQLFGRVLGLARISFIDEGRRRIVSDIVDELAREPAETPEQLFAVVDEVGAPLASLPPITKTEFTGALF